MTEEEVRTVRFPRALAHRIASTLEDKSLGYLGVEDFVLSAVRQELERAEKTSYFLKEGRK